MTGAVYLRASLRGDGRTVCVRLVWRDNGPDGPGYYWRDRRSYVRGCSAPTIDGARALLAQAYAAPIFRLRFEA